ncbi:MAG: hypothetical protein RLZZ312_124 [Bacteroidota bacterium]|jgi:ubiquinone/menaquinone biosynthesis C-methylase UbiE
MILENLKNIIKKEKFHPGFLGFIINNNFLIRKALQKTIKSNAHLLNGNLLDFGCGSKPYKCFFINIEKYIGIDYKIEGRDGHQKEVDVFYDGKKIPFDDNYFDSILCTEVLEHVFNIEELLSEFNRVLKPKGKVLITTPFMWEEHEMPYDFARYTTPALEYLYKKNGFKIIKNHKVGDYIQVIMQFNINYIKNILPKNKIAKQVFLIPFILFFNLCGIILGFILPTEQTAYFNNIFFIEKI